MRTLPYHSIQSSLSLSLAQLGPSLFSCFYFTFLKPIFNCPTIPTIQLNYPFYFPNTNIVTQKLSALKSSTNFVHIYSLFILILNECSQRPPLCCDFILSSMNPIVVTPWPPAKCYSCLWWWYKWCNPGEYFTKKP